MKKQEELKEDKNNLIVKEICPDKELIYEVLGISEERAEELGKICQEYFIKSDTLTHALEEISKQCLHVNEVVFTTIVCLKVQMRIGERDPLSSLMELLSKLKRED